MPKRIVKRHYVQDPSEVSEVSGIHVNNNYEVDALLNPNDDRENNEIYLEDFPIHDYEEWSKKELIVLYNLNKKYNWTKKLKRIKMMEKFNSIMYVLNLPLGFDLYKRKQIIYNCISEFFIQMNGLDFKEEADIKITYNWRRSEELKQFNIDIEDLKNYFQNKH